MNNTILASEGNQFKTTNYVCQSMNLKWA